MDGTRLIFLLKRFASAKFKKQMDLQVRRKGGAMKEILKKLRDREAALEMYEEAVDYWLNIPEPDQKKADYYESLTDDTYEEVYNLFQQAADRIVSITSGQIDKITAMRLMRVKRDVVERLFG